MRTVLDLVWRGDERAILALDVYVHHLRAGVAAMAAAMGGLDALAFSGGVGEHAPLVRAEVADGLGFLGVALDAHVNECGAGDRDLSAAGAPVSTVVVGAAEDLEMARQVHAVLAAELR